MEIYSPLPIVIITAISIATAYLFKIFLPVQAFDSWRHEEIDGLRGFLAVFMFIHHSSVWYSYIKNGVWAVPSSAVYTNIGQIGIILFFMISSFLFFTKIRKSKVIDWKKLYISRIARLAPLFLFLFILVLIVVGFSTEWAPRVPFRDIIFSILSWLPFTLFGQKDINGLPDTFIIVAGVPWSLVFEWLLYASLPLLRVLLLKRVPFFYILLSLVLVFIITRSLSYSPKFVLLAFALGGASSYVADYEKIRNFSRKKVASFVSIGIFIYTACSYQGVYATEPIVLISTAFALICCGCGFFGILRFNAVKILGQVSYGIYMLHGVVLFVSFRFLFGFDFIGALSSTSYWVVVFSITPIVISISIFSFYFIESPVIKMADRAMKNNGLIK